MYYGHMSKSDIMHSSRAFLISIYQKYVNRACENLGVSSESENEQEDEDEYPSKFKKFSQEERNQYIEESSMSDEDFAKQLDEISFR